MKHKTQAAKLRQASKATIVKLHPSAVTQPIPNGRMRLACATSNGIHLLELNKINYCAADGNYVRVYYGDNHNLVLSKTLGAIARRLPPEQFIRVHQSYVINLNAIVRLDTSNVYLKNGVAVSVSRRYRTILKTRIMQNAL